jgi:hypothetical protein
MQQDGEHISDTARHASLKEVINTRQDSARRLREYEISLVAVRKSAIECGVGIASLVAGFEL